MKNLVLLFTGLLVLNTAEAIPLHNFNDVKLAVSTGKTIHIAINSAKCSNATKLNDSMNIGLFTPNEMAVLDTHIDTSLTHFTLNDPFFPGKAVYEFETYSITADNTVNLTDQVLDAVSYAALTDKFSFVCKIDDGADIYVD